MTRLPCEHGILLPRNLRCVHGYLEFLVVHKGKQHCKVFGKHDSESQLIAEKYAAEKRLERKLGRFDIDPPSTSKTFKEVREIWFNKWSNEKDSKGELVHSPKSIASTKYVWDKIGLTFDKMFYESVAPVDIKKWREDMINSGASPTTADRHQGLITAMYNGIPKLIDNKEIRNTFALPKANPCSSIKKSDGKDRVRGIPTDYELAKIKNACFQLNDLEVWKNCKWLLMTALSLGDLKRLQIGQQIKIKRSKTGAPIDLPIVMTENLNWTNWTKRFKAVRQTAGCLHIQAKDFRKKANNWLIGNFDTKLRANYLAHDEATNNQHYDAHESEKLKPLADFLANKVEAI